MREGFARVCIGKRNVHTRLNSIYLYGNTDRTTERVGLTLKNEFNSFQVTARMDGYYDACDISYVWNAHIRISTYASVFVDMVASQRAFFNVGYSTRRAADILAAQQHIVTIELSSHSVTAHLLIRAPMRAELGSSLFRLISFCVNKIIFYFC